MKDIVFQGNVLDIGFKNNGVIYNIYKESNNNINIEYLRGKEDKNKIVENFYDTCILFFSFNNFWTSIRKRKFLLDISKYLKNDGIIYIWDIDKGFTKVIDCTLKIIMPKMETRRIKIKDLNPFKNNSKKSNIKIIEKYFDIIDIKEYNKVYCLKAKKYIQQHVNNSAKNNSKQGNTNTA